MFEARMSLRSAHLLALFAAFAVACGDDPVGPGVDGAIADQGVLPPDGSSTDSGVVTADSGGGPDASGLTDGAIDPNDPLNATRDSDCDGLSDAYELSTVYPDGQKTNPLNPDSDGDGLIDGLEVGRTTGVPGASCPNLILDSDPSSRTSPTTHDTDGDGLLDGIEDVNKNGAVDPGETDPNRRDTDGDGLPDGIEDANGNGLRDVGETDPTNVDSDGDGISDGIEDANLNGTFDVGETDPRNTDTDGDGIPDGDEDTNRNGIREPYELDPRSPDTDCDGISDPEELVNGTSPIRADTDRDGLSDGIELGRTQPVAGSNCPAFVGDADPTTTTDPLRADSDGDGLSDGAEDRNKNGAVDVGETDANNPDSDNDGLWDGDEVNAGFDPLNPGSPSGAEASALVAICSTQNLQPIDLDRGNPGEWTLANDPSLSYAGIPTTQPAVRVGALDDGTRQIAGFVVQMPFIGGAANTAVGQSGVLAARLSSAAAGESVTINSRQSPRFITTHDGFEAAVSGLLEIGVVGQPINPARVRNAILRAATGLAAGDFTGLSVSTGANAASFMMSFELLVRADHLVLVAAVLEQTAFENVADTRSIVLADLTNGTALAERDAEVGRACNSFIAAGQLVADFVWMADISASTDDDRGRIVTAAGQVFDALSANNVDFRMAVVSHAQSVYHVGANAGTLRGTGFTTNRTTFTQYLQDVSGTDGCEFGLESVYSAVERALPRTANPTPLKLRANATLAVVYISDENAQEVEEGPCYNLPQAIGCPTGIPDVWNPDNPNACNFAPNTAQRTCITQITQKYIDQLRREASIAFGQVFDPIPRGACTQGQFYCVGSAQDRNEPGNGYVEVINATGGIFYSPCEANPGAGSLQAIVDAVSGAASQFVLGGNPISATLKVGLTRVGETTTTVVPRSKQDGFDYDPVSNSVFFRGTTYRPAAGDRVTVSYRVWQEPTPPCGDPCAPGQACDPGLGVCLCDLGACDANCGPNSVCGTDCACTCPSNCNGNCTPGQVCNTANCQCECPSDCGGCPAGTQCNRDTCACECDSSCGGACGAGPLECNGGACACECPSDCGGCGPGALCNQSTCECSCGPDCSSACPGNGTCNPANNCACECPFDCGGCPDGTICNANTCACECGARCDQGCPGDQVCDPNNECACGCPADCGGRCNASEICDQAQCRCISAV